MPASPKNSLFVKPPILTSQDLVELHAALNVGDGDMQLSDAELIDLALELINLFDVLWKPSR